MQSPAFDRQMMAMALRMARRGLGATAPNPAVGAVIADEATGDVIARGWTAPGGRPHAEPQAISRAAGLAWGKTLYVTLEPCAHHGQTPPCAEAVIAAGLARVVVGCLDPDPRTAGKGVAALRAAGIAVEDNVLGDEARALTAGHILRITQSRPFVQIKIALGTNSEVPFGRDRAPAIATSAVARARGHLVRAQTDAILVGRKTVLDDDPELTCRLPGLHDRSPVRVVLAATGEGLSKSKLAMTAKPTPLWVFTGPEAPAAEIASLQSAGARLFPVTLNGGRLSVRDVLSVLASAGITRLLVEGGPEIWRSFASLGLVDEVVVFHAGIAGGSPAAYQSRTEAAIKRYLLALPLRLVANQRIGDDAMVTYQRPSKLSD
jgi:diaminohydroxyphosphoribosylaminopyrimidine deaminase / 5-amino-6-(5-phosphoribosylamino)uracil reductase